MNIPLAEETSTNIGDITPGGKTYDYDDNENKGSQDQSGPQAMQKAGGETEELDPNPSSGDNEPGSANAAKSTTSQYARFDISQREGGKSQQPIIRKDVRVNTTLSRHIHSN